MDSDRFAAELVLVKKELDAYRQKCTDLEDELRLSVEASDKNLVNMSASQKAIIDSLNTQLEESTGKSLLELEKLSTAVRIKTKMLDDQNETIKTLKQNLENKIRQQEQSTGSFQDKIEDLNERLYAAKDKIRKLEDELDSQREAIEREIKADYRAERDELKSQVQDLERKLLERNDNILKIEQEVRKVRKIFKQKEEKWISEQSILLEEKDAKISQLELLLEVFDNANARTKAKGYRGSLKLKKSN